MARFTNGEFSSLVRGGLPNERISAVLSYISFVLYMLNRIYAQFSFAVNFVLYGFLYLFLRGVPPTYHTRPKLGYSPGVFVTGAGEGIGKATAILLAKSGYTVFAGVLKLEHKQQLLNQYDSESNETGGSLHPMVCDVLKDEDLRSCVEHIRKIDQNNTSKPFVALVNNAGFCMISPLELTSQYDIMRMINIDLVAYVNVTKAFLPLLKRHRGRVVNIGSYGGYTAVPGWTVYNGMKAAIDNLTRAWSFETTEPYGIRMSVVRPGFVATEGIGPKITKSMKDYSESETAIGFDSLGNVMEPDRSAASGDIAHYSRTMRKWKALVSVYTALGTSPENVAKTVRDALTEAWMQPVYTVAWDALLAQMIRDFTPEPIYEWSVLKLFT